MDPLLGPAGSALEAALRFRTARAGVLAGNVANADTPGYRRRELHFEGVLGEAEERLARTDARHLPTPSDGSYRVELGPRGTRPDGNAVDLDEELILVQRNAGAFQDQAAVLARLSNLARRAIGGG